MTERNPYAPPQAEVRDAPAARPTKGTLATRTLRLAGAIIDSVASAVFVVPFLVFTSDWTAAISGELSYGRISLGGFAVFTAMQGYRVPDFVQRPRAVHVARDAEFPMIAGSCTLYFQRASGTRVAMKR